MLSIIAVGLTGLVGCGRLEEPGHAPAAGGGEPARAEAVLAATASGSAVSGTVSLTDTPEGLQVEAWVANAPPGPHGFHIHEHGSCAEAGNAAGGHFNPHGVPHGFLPRDGAYKAHAGDMGNIEIGGNGEGALEIAMPGLTVAEGPTGVLGRAVILHELGDDFGQPTGNAGGRIACGVIEPVR
jgi:Cu-Zn family superoxide dismutase